MRTTGNSNKDQAGRNMLAGAGGRLIGGAGRTGKEIHGKASPRGRGDFTGCKSTGRTNPLEIASIRAATRIEGPRCRNRNLRTPKAEIPPIRSAISASDNPSERIQIFRSIASAPFGTVADPADHLSADRLAEALAVMMLDLVAALDVSDQRGVLERLANRLDDKGRLPGGSGAALLLGQVGALLMQTGM